MGWIVALTRPNHESIAEHNLTRQGYVNYCPRFLQKPSVVRPLFPRYIFIFIDNTWSSILGTRGISRVILGDNGPQHLPSAEIDKLRAKEINGLVSLSSPPRFQPGDKVRTDEGPLSGLLLVYEGMRDADRIKVLVDLLGRKVLVELDAKTVVAA